jgi:hypothetical protein
MIIPAEYPATKREKPIGRRRMTRITRFSLPAALLLAGLGACAMDRQAGADDGMSFFVTSVGTGQGADLGSLAACRTEVFSQALRSAVTGLAEPADLAFSW